MSMIPSGEVQELLWSKEHSLQAGIQRPRGCFCPLITKALYFSLILTLMTLLPQKTPTNVGFDLLPSGKEEGEFMGWRYQCPESIPLDFLHDTYLIFLTLFTNWKTEPCTGTSRAKAGQQESSLYSLPSAAVLEWARLPSHFVINSLHLK